MSSRTARSVGGAKNNDQLFSARSINDPQNDRFGESNRSSAANLAHNPSASVQPSPQPLSVREQLGVQVSEDADPLQIEHMMGYCGDYRKTVVCLPNDEQSFVRSLGCLVTLENLNDPHNQRFLRGHDMPVCSVTVSRTGRYIASGQLGTTHYKGRAAPVLLWKGDTCQRMGVLRGLSEKVSILAFSQDERFICGCGDDCLLYIWDVSTGEVVYGQKVASPVAILQWADQKKVNHNIDYELVIGMQNVIYQGLFTYDSFRMQWSMKLRAYTVPPMGSLIRTFFCLDFSRDRIFPYIGTSSGEMLVYRRDTVVFRSCIPVCTNGLQDIVVLSDDSVICGGGDGMFVKLVGSDMTWQKVFELKLDSLVLSLSLAANNQELIVACSSGAIYRYLTASMTQTLVSVSPNSPINAIAFPNTTYPAPSTVYYFATGTRAGEIRVWDLTDYACLSVYRLPKSGAVLSLAMVDSDRIISGWQDGSIRCTDSNGKLLWSIPTAHRDGTTTIAAHVDSSLQYFASGGGDGAIRVWKYSNRELITQYTEHRKGVSKIIIDLKSPNIVHSVGGDCSVLSYDLKAGRRIICHIVNNGVMANMTQRKDGENEIITSDSYGRLLYWDVDIREPVLAVQDPARQLIRACQISPSGRFLAFAGDDQILKILDCINFQIISLGQSHSGPILSLHWTPDERQVLTGGEDTCVSIWNFYLGGEGKQKINEDQFIDKSKQIKTI